MTMKTLTYTVATGKTPLVLKAVELLGRYLLERHDTTLEESGARARIILDIRTGVGAEGFRIDNDGARVMRLCGNDERGLLYAVGKYLRDPGWRGTTVPEKPIRGIYFATHFHNIYHDGPVEFIQRYVEELSLWGCNALCVWFDMHHYTGIDDPAAQEMIARLRAIFKSASDCGITLWLTSVANEAFASSPPELRADFSFGKNGYHSGIGAYGVEICPNKPGGIEKILEYRRQLLEAFRDLDIGMFSMGPYDQGGCTCPTCAPWGANGYLKTGEAVFRLEREFFPKAKFVLSTWYFDKHIEGEWAGLERAFAKRPDWVDYLMADNAGEFPAYPRQHGIPGGLPAMNFPEISMGLMWPWGGFGANPRLNYWQKYWENVGPMMAGGIPYSEGIYEDFNKVLQLQLYWGGNRTTRDIAREYAAGEFSPECADDAVTVMELLEAAMDHSLDQGAALSVLEGGGWEKRKGNLPQVYSLPRVKDPGPCAKLARKIDSLLSPAARGAWRWRLVWLRAALDEELYCSKGRPTTKSDEYFEELQRIYHAESAELVVSPVGTKALTNLEHALTPIAKFPDIPHGRQYSKFISTWQVSHLMPKTVAAAPAVTLSDPLDWQTISTLKKAPGIINVHTLFGNDDGIAYLASRFRVRKPGRWILHVGHDGGVRVFVNGRVVLTNPERKNPATVFRSRATITLGKGIHEIVIGLDTSNGMGWGLCCFFETTAKAGKSAGRAVFPLPIPVRKK